MLASLARALQLTLAERDHLFYLAGHNPPDHRMRSDHVSPGTQSAERLRLLGVVGSQQLTSIVT